jgi:Rrf2 family protein
MFKLHKKVKYALTALKHIKTLPSGSLVTAKEICTRYELPFDPASRVLQIMTQQGILEAVQGAYGGYRLVGDLTKLSLYNLSEMIAGSLAITDCTSDNPECDRLDKCVLKKEMAYLNTRLVKLFKDVIISEMI